MQTVYPNREIYADPPLALVAAEVRFTDAARLRQQQTKDEVTIALESYFPIAEQLQQTEVELTHVPVGGQPQIRERRGVVLKNLDSTATMTIMSESLTYETTRYTSFEDLLDSVVAACAALHDAKVLPALRRIGLRYIDEVRVPEVVTDVRQWDAWVDERLISHLAVGPEDVPVAGTQGISTYDLGEGKGLNFRFAALDQGSVVVPQHLQRRAVPSGPFFVLDFDGFRDFPSDEFSPLSASVVRDTLSAVHVPCGSTFQRSITDKARELFRGSVS